MANLFLPEVGTQANGVVMGTVDWVCRSWMGMFEGADASNKQQGCAGKLKCKGCQ